MRIDDCILFPSNQKSEYIKAYDGDAVCLAHIGTVHTSVLSQVVFALTTRRGGDCGVVVMEREDE